MLQLIQVYFAEEEIEVVQTAQELPPPPPPPAPEIVEILNVVEDNVEVASVEINTEDDKNKVVVISAPVTSSAPIEEEEDQVIFQVVEKMPSFPVEMQHCLNFEWKCKISGCAQENGVQGRVICQFVVNRDGSIVDVEVVRSVDASLDKEAIRVIKSMPKWSPTTTWKTGTC